ncbi:MAG: putative lipid II flippase FtsW [Holosporaceae bacterium]|jgi:cell division protein FtsW|nr:putative lipid II flippase FtsW [Holosporaceae bacterium]
MFSFSRTDNGIMGTWWWTVDRVMLFSFLIIVGIGVLMAVAATPMVAHHLGVERFFFLKKHLTYMAPALLLMFFISTFDNSSIKKLSLFLFFASLLLMILTFFMGTEIKGARRWISIFSLSLQPSEFMKPALVVITAWMFAEERKNSEFRGRFIAAIFLLISVFLLLLQPDIGMTVLITGIWFAQWFLNGLSMILVLTVIILAVCGFILAYLFLPHVTTRIDRFLDPSAGDHYQINRSLEAFANGGLFGVGPGEGVIKKHLPDAHADFVFAVLGEEFGFFVCAFVVFLIGFIVIYGMIKALKDNDLFNLLASVGLLSQFGLQSFINIASTLHLIPTKGMTLPLISYGGSSLLAISISVGMILALGKRKNIHYEKE